VKVDGPPGRSTAFNASTFATRDSGVGLRGGFGEVALGKFRTYFADHIPSGDTLFLKSSLAASISALFGASSTIGGQATGLAGLTPAGGFAPANAEGRGAVDSGGFRDNVLRYTTPNWGGFTAGLSYIAPEGTVNIPTNTAASNAGKASDKGIGVRLTYLNPNLGFATYSYYKRDDLFAGTALGSLGNDSKNQKIAIGTKLVGFTVGVAAEKIQHTNPDLIATAANDSVDREVKKYAFFIAYETGPWAFGTSYAKANKVDDNTGGNCAPLPNCDGTGAKFYQATVLYNFSKRSNVYLTFAKVKNDSTAAYDFYTQAAVGDTGPSFIARGSSPQVLAAGITHYF
jgi:predicted porin